MQSFQPRSKPRAGKAAFSLVEMLVVIAIISILMTAGSIGLSGIGGKGVTSGVATAEAIFDEARSTAVGRNLRACVLIARSLANNPENDLRRIVIAYEETNTDGSAKHPEKGQPKWVLSSRGIVLPDQTFFSEKFSKKDHSADPGAVETSTTGPIDTVVLAEVSPAYQGEYFIYEFNAQGVAKYDKGASFVIGSGVRRGNLPATTQPPRVTASGKRDFGGFVVWRNGRTSVFRSPDQIGEELKSIRSGETF